MPISPARTTAFYLLQLVERGGYAADLLHFRTAELDPRDAGLAHEIVFGVLRYRAQLDYLSSNRRVGRAVTIFTGGLRLALITGALLVHMGLVISGSQPFAWWWPLVWLVLAGILAWLVPSFLRRVESLSHRLPTFDELGRPGEP